MATKEDPSWKKRRATAKPSIEGPDAFQSTIPRLLDRLRPHFKLLAFGLGVGLLLWAGVFGYRYFKNKKAMKATAAFAKALRVGAGKVTTAEPPKEPDEGALPTFKTEEDKNKAFLQELDSAKQSGGSFATYAELLRASTLFKLGKLDEAQAAYKTFLDKSKNSPYRFVALEGLGYTYEAKGDLDSALKRFAEMDPDPAKPGTGLGEERALWHQGRILATKGEKAKAIEMFKKLVDGFPGSPLKSSAQDRLAALEST